MPFKVSRCRWPDRAQIASSSAAASVRSVRWRRGPERTGISMLSARAGDLSPAQGLCDGGVNWARRSYGGEYDSFRCSQRERRPLPGCLGISFSCLVHVRSERTDLRSAPPSAGLHTAH